MATPCINHCWVCAHLENPCGIFQRSFLLGMVRALTRNGSYTKTLQASVGRPTVLNINRQKNDPKANASQN
jgi:hypothetical protein